MQFKLSLPIMRLNICPILNYIKYLIVIYTNSFSNRTVLVVKNDQDDRKSKFHRYHRIQWTKKSQKICFFYLPLHFEFARFAPYIWRSYHAMRSRRVKDVVGIEQNLKKYLRYQKYSLSMTSASEFGCVDIQTSSLCQTRIQTRTS